MNPRSAISGVVWPAVPDGDGASVLAIEHQLDESQWLAPDELGRLQFEALGRLLRHACGSVPHYRGLDAYRALADNASITPEDWGRLPVLTRNEVQEAGSALRSERVPPSHLPVTEVSTSGSTGRPVRALVTRATNLFWKAITLRELLWQERDLTAKLAVVRTDRAGRVPPGGLFISDWGAAVNRVCETGPAALLSVQRDVEAQARWLVDYDPDYLLSLPSNLLALAQHFAQSGQRLPRLREASSYGEVLGPQVRPACREAWGVDVIDMYSTEELGYLALQCPQGEQYHVQAEVVHLEVLDEGGRPCGPGDTGRVVATALHNYAMPLLRYELGDYAEVGPACVCGRGLPVLTRVMGRQRNMLSLPDGRRFWPTFGRAWREIGVIRQMQLVQRELDHVHARIVGPRPLTPEEESRFTSVLQDRFGYPFRVSFEYLERIDRSRSLKFEDFVSLVQPQADGGHLA